MRSGSVVVRGAASSRRPRSVWRGTGFATGPRPIAAFAETKLSSVCLVAHSKTDSSEESVGEFWLGHWSFQFVNVLNLFQPANPTLHIDSPATLE